MEKVLTRWLTRLTRLLAVLLWVNTCWQGRQHMGLLQREEVPQGTFR